MSGQKLYSPATPRRSPTSTPPKPNPFLEMFGGKQDQQFSPNYRDLSDNSDGWVDAEVPPGAYMTDGNGKILSGNLRGNAPKNDFWYTPSQQTSGGLYQPIATPQVNTPQVTPQVNSLSPPSPVNNTRSVQQVVDNAQPTSSPALSALQGQLENLQGTLGGRTLVNVNRANEIGGLYVPLSNAARIAPNPYDVAGAQAQEQGLEAGKVADYYGSHPAPQLQQPGFIPLPDRQQVPIPTRGENVNEQTAYLAGGIISALGGGKSQAATAIPGLVQRGIQSDDQDYTDAQTKFQQALQASGINYNDALNARNAQAAYGQQGAQINYENAQAQQAQGTKQAELQGQQAGANSLSTANQGFAGNQRQVAAAQFDFQRGMAALEENARYDATSNQQYVEASKMLNDAAQLYNTGRYQESEALLNQAHGIVFKATAQQIANEDTRAGQLHGFKLKGAQQDLDRGTVEINNEKKKGGLLDAQSKLYASEANKNNATARSIDAGDKYLNAKLKYEFGEDKLAQQKVQAQLQPFLDLDKQLEGQINDVVKQRAAFEANPQITDPKDPNRVLGPNSDSNTYYRQYMLRRDALINLQSELEAKRVANYNARMHVFNSLLLQNGKPGLYPALGGKAGQNPPATGSTTLPNGVKVKVNPPPKK